VQPANPNLLRDRLANERTFLAWLRTGIAISSLGFVVARFDIFLQELARANAQTVPAERGAVPIGVVLVIAGPVLVVLAAVRFVQTERTLLSGRPHSRRVLRTLVMATTAGCIAAGVGLAIHLLTRWPV
jgi:putative membrane protein